MSREFDRAIVAFLFCLGAMLTDAAAVHAAAPCQLGRVASIDAPIEHGRIVVTVELNDRPTRLLVDTGSPFDILSEAVADELHLPRQGIRTGAVMDLTGSKPPSEAYVSKITLAGMTAERVRFLVVPSWNPESAMVDGAFSENYLAAYDVEFDFAQAKLNLFQQNEACGDRVVYWSDEFVEIPFKLDESRHIIFPVKLDGRDVRAMLDTGAFTPSLDAMVAEHIFGLRPPTLSPEEQYRVSGANAARSIPAYEANFGQLEMGGITFKNVAVNVIPDRTGAIYDLDKARFGQPELRSNIKTDLIIGLKQLSALHLFIAFSQKKLYATSATASR